MASTTYLTAARASFIKVSSVLIACMALAVAGTASAGIYRMDFTVENLGTQSPISGSFTWEATSATAAIDNLVSVDLAIGGHTYSLSELGFVNYTSSNNIAIGAGPGTLAVQDSTDDFLIRWDRTTGTPNLFVYATASCGCVPYGDYTGSTVTQFTISEADAATSVSAVDHGFYQADTATPNFNGFHNTVNNTYLARVTSSSENRNFFVFDLSALTDTIAAAKLRVESISTSPNAGTFTLYDVDTPISTLTASHFVTDGVSNPEGLDIFDDLGTGTAYGSTSLTPVNALCNNNVKPGTDPACPSVIEEIEFNAEGVAALNAASGLFAVGGRIDVGTVFASSGAGQIGYFLVELLVQSGPGELFSDSGQTLGTDSSASVALGDIDGDGDLDAFVGVDVFAPNKVWVNDGNGIFTDSLQALGSGSSRAVGLADFDDDGDLDAFVANGNGTTGAEPDRVWLNDGTGLFSAGQELGSYPSFSLAVGDIDGDGDLDAVTGNISGSTEKIWLGEGGGAATFVLSAFSFPDQGTVVSVDLGDIDGDSDLDVVFGTFGGGTEVWRNNGDGTFVDDSLNAPGVHRTALGDIDADGDQDMFIAERSFSTGPGNRILTNDGAGLFQDSSQSLGGSNSFGVVLADLDGDVDLDGFVVNNNAANKVWLNDGVGVFNDSGLELGSGYSVDVALGDIDGDGDLDAFVANAGADKVWINNSPNGSAQSDVDGDGVPDVIDPCPADRFDGCNQGGSAAELIDSDEGGEVKTDDNQLTIVIEPEDLGTDETISITEAIVVDDEVELSVGANGSDGEPLALYNLEPDGLMFDNEVTLIFELDVTALTPAQRDNLDVYRQEDLLNNDGIPDTFVSLGADCTVAETPVGTGTLKASCEVGVMHFSRYGFFAPADKDRDGDLDNFNGVVDPCPNENATGFDVDGDSCIDDIEGLGEMVSNLALPSNGVIDPAMENSLLSKLANAQKSQDKDNICALVNQLQAFQAQVNAQVGKKISIAAASDVLAYADSVIAYVQFFLEPNESC